MVEISLVKGLGMSMNVIINPRWHSNRYLRGLQQSIMAGLEKEVLAAKAFLLRSSQGSHHNLYVSHVSIIAVCFLQGKGYSVSVLAGVVLCCKLCRYDHLSECLSKILDERPNDVLGNLNGGTVEQTCQYTAAPMLCSQ